MELEKNEEFIYIGALVSRCILFEELDFRPMRVTLEPTLLSVTGSTISPM